MNNRVRTLWERGEPAVVGWLQMPGTLHAEALARAGYDAIVIDLQHSPIDFSTAVPMIIAIENGGAEPFVRVRWNDASEIMKLLDAGAYGIVVPMIDTAEQAGLFASALHYPPRGVRSFGPRRPPFRFGPGYAAMASQTVVSLAMIETRDGIDNLDAILATEGFDGVFIGPTDLALALGKEPKPDSSDPAVVEVVRTIRERAHAAGKKAGIFCAGGAFAREKLAEGFDLVSVAPDLAMLVGAARAIVEETRRGLPARQPG
jgi:4-hydroxy-2-oxoheptanedioate aldolase